MTQVTWAPPFKRSYKNLPQEIKPTIDEAIETLFNSPDDLPPSYKDKKLKNKTYQKDWGGKVRCVRPGTNKYRLAYSIERTKKKEKGKKAREDIIITLIFVSTRQNYYRQLDQKS